MKAISLWQPYASAIVLDLKRIETRGWRTHHRGLLAIHAALKWDEEQQEFAASERALGRLPARLPFGAIIAVVDLIDVKSTDELIDTVSPIEKLYGNYKPGRYGWILDNVRVLEKPIPCRGAQGLFNVPDELIELPATAA